MLTEINPAKSHQGRGHSMLYFFLRPGSSELPKLTPPAPLAPPPSVQVKAGSVTVRVSPLMNSAVCSGDMQLARATRDLKITHPGGFDSLPKTFVKIFTPYSAPSHII